MLRIPQARSLGTITLGTTKDCRNLTTRVLGLPQIVPVARLQLLRWPQRRRMIPRTITAGTAKVGTTVHGINHRRQEKDLGNPRAPQVLQLLKPLQLTRKDNILRIPWPAKVIQLLWLVRLVRRSWRMTITRKSASSS